MKYTIGDIVTIISPLDAGDEDYLNKTGVIQEITKNDNEPDRLIYGVRFNSFATDTDRYFYDTQKSVPESRRHPCQPSGFRPL